MIDFSPASPLFRALGETSRAVERALMPRDPLAPSGHLIAAPDRASVGSPFHSEMNLNSPFPQHASLLDFPPASRPRVSVETPAVQRPSRRLPARRRSNRQLPSRSMSTIQQPSPSRDPLQSFGRMMGATFGFVGDLSHFIADTGVRAVQGVANGFTSAASAVVQAGVTVARGVADGVGRVASAVVDAGKTLVKGSLERTADAIQGVGQAVSAPFRWLAGLFG